MTNCKAEDCGFCKHWAKDHKDAPQDLSCIKIVFLDQIDNPGPREEDFPNFKKLEGRWMANLGCLVSMDLIFVMMQNPNSNGKTDKTNKI